MRGTTSAAILPLCAWISLWGCSPKPDAVPAPPPSAAAPAPVAPPQTKPAAGGVVLLDAADKPVSEVRLANLSPASFDSKGLLREDAVAASPDRLRVLVEDPAADVPASVAVSFKPSDPPLTLTLAGPPGRRLSRPFLLLGDREDAAAGAGMVLLAAPGGKLEVRHRNDVAAFRVGPLAVHQIPVRFVAVGKELPAVAELEKAAELRLAQANVVWEPFGRRFVRGPVVRLDAVRGLFVIRGRAAGVDGQGRPSRCGIVLDGREVAVPGTWRNDGAPMTPKATARGLIEQAGKSFSIDLFDGLLAGDKESVVVRVRRREGSAATVERLPGGGDVAQSVAPIQVDGTEGVEVAPTASLLSLEEMALLASGKGPPSEGFDVFVVPGLHSLQARPAFKVYPDGVFPVSLSGSAVVSWPLLDGTGKYPYGLARVAGELLLPPGARPGPEDTLFADPPSEGFGVEGHKRVTSATGRNIAERGRGLPAGK
jgi:hypothetical protein